MSRPSLASPLRLVAENGGESGPRVPDRFPITSVISKTPCRTTFTIKFEVPWRTSFLKIAVCLTWDQDTSPRIKGPRQQPHLAPASGEISSPKLVSQRPLTMNVIGSVSLSFFFAELLSFFEVRPTSISARFYDSLILLITEYFFSFLLCPGSPGAPPSPDNRARVLSVASNLLLRTVLVSFLVVSLSRLNG